MKTIYFYRVSQVLVPIEDDNCEAQAKRSLYEGELGSLLVELSYQVVIVLQLQT